MATQSANNPRTTTVEQTSLLDRIVEQQAEAAARYKPVMSIAELQERNKAVQYLVEQVMVEGVDYGIVPGTRREPAKAGEYKTKPTLFKAGAERACAFFGYAPRFKAQAVIECWTDEQYGEMLFYYRFECDLSKDEHIVGSGIGSASTWESKYRRRTAERTCPHCGLENIRKSKPKPGQSGLPGFYCWEKTGGCGATFAADDKSITGQEIGKNANPDIADVINTVLKMAQKRAYVAATLTATGLSGIFGQDLEDMPPPPAPPPPSASTPPPPEPQPTGKPRPNLTFAERLAEFNRQAARVGPQAFAAVLRRYNFEHANEVCASADVGLQRRVYRELSQLPDLADTAQEPPLPEPPTEEAPDGGSSNF